MTFKKGHPYYRPKSLEEFKRIMSLAMQGKNKGKIPWNKGLTRETDSRVDDYVRKETGLKRTIEQRKNISLAHLGYKRSLDSRKKQGESIMGHKVSEETRKKISLKNKGIVNKGRILSEEHIKKCLKRNLKSSLEIKFENIINQLGLPYKFVGNGEMMVARKCPDFVDKNGEKIAIEVFYRRHKQLFRGGLEEWKANRARIFNDNGWELIFFDETEVNEDKIKIKLMKGGNKIQNGSIN